MTSTLLSKINPFIKHAENLQKKDPIMSYYCFYYAIQEGIRLRSAYPDEESKKLLLGLMDKLEKQKDELGPAVEDQEKGREHVEKFANQIFQSADDEDRAGKASKMTAFNFLIASQFFDVLKQFGEIPTDIAAKQKYAKWKATDISQSLKQGKKPKPGGPGEELSKEDENLNEESSFPEPPLKPQNDNNFIQDTSNSFPSIPDPPQNLMGGMDKDINPFPKPPTYSEEKTEIFNNNFQVSSSSGGGGIGNHNPPFGGVATPFTPTTTTTTSNYLSPSSLSTPNKGHQPNVELAEKYTKFVLSSLNFEDVPAAVKYLKMAYHELTGQDL